jgi:hypothetical protein
MPMPHFPWRGEYIVKHQPEFRPPVSFSFFVVLWRPLDTFAPRGPAHQPRRSARCHMLEN